jgi:hypothetical protein
MQDMGTEDVLSMFSENQEEEKDLVGEMDYKIDRKGLASDDEEDADEEKK